MGEIYIDCWIWLTRKSKSHGCLQGPDVETLHCEEEKTFPDPRGANCTHQYDAGALYTERFYAEEEWGIEDFIAKGEAWFYRYCTDGFAFDFKSSTGQMERNDSLILGALTQKILISIDTYQRLGTSDIMVSTMMFEVDLRRTAWHRFCPTAQARAEAYHQIEV